MNKQEEALSFLKAIREKAYEIFEHAGSKFHSGCADLIVYWCDTLTEDIKTYDKVDFFMIVRYRFDQLIDEEKNITNSFHAAEFYVVKSFFQDLMSWCNPEYEQERYTMRTGFVGDFSAKFSIGNNRKK